MVQQPETSIADLVSERYGAQLEEAGDNQPFLHAMLARGSCREFHDTPVADGLIALIAAAAFAAPSKSDLQQRDMVILKDPAQRQKLSALVAGQAWVAKAPLIAVFCGNNRRQRLLHDWHDIPFANDHFDAPFNAIADAAIALGAFVTAAEALGLGCCPISAVRNKADAVSHILHLPKHVFPVAGLAIGYPAQAAQISRRLPLDVTCHVDHYREDNLEQAVARYDTDRATTQPYGTQRFAQTFGENPDYGWSTDKARQYSQPERADFGAYMRAQGFRFD